MRLFSSISDAGTEDSLLAAGRLAELGMTVFVVWLAGFIDYGRVPKS